MPQPQLSLCRGGCGKQTANAGGLCRVCLSQDTAGMIPPKPQGRARIRPESLGRTGARIFHDPRRDHHGRER